MHRPKHLLVVEDSAQLQRALVAALGSRVERVTCAGTLAEARGVLSADPPDAVVLDVALPDGDSEALLPQLRTLRPVPHVIAVSGSASPDQAFRLAQAGVRAFVPKPLDLAKLDEQWTRSLSEPPDLEPLVRASVGRVPLHRMEQVVREAAVDQALAQAAGSRRSAAKSLSISRQLLQYILQRQKR